MYTHILYTYVQHTYLYHTQACVHTQVYNLSINSDSSAMSNYTERRKWICKNCCEFIGIELSGCGGREEEKPCWLWEWRRMLHSWLSNEGGRAKLCQKEMGKTMKSTSVRRQKSTHSSAVSAPWTKTINFQHTKKSDWSHGSNHNIEKRSGIGKECAYGKFLWFLECHKTKNLSCWQVLNHIMIKCFMGIKK